MKNVFTFILLGFLSVNAIDELLLGPNQHNHGHSHNRDLSNKRSCGFVEPTPDQRAEIDATVAKHMARAKPLSKTDEIIVDVYWHVLKNSNGDGDYTDAVIEKSIQILNDAFGGVESSYSECSGAGQSFTYSSFPSSPFKFVLKNINRVTDNGAHNLDASSSETYRENNRVGDCSDMNVFTGATSYLGFAYLPSSCPNGNFQNPRKYDAVW